MRYSDGEPAITRGPGRLTDVVAGRGSGRQLGGRLSTIRLVTGRGVRLLGIALALGCAGTLVAGRWLGALLYGVRSLDPVTLGGAGVVLALAAFLGTYLPARRASRV